MKTEHNENDKKKVRLDTSRHVKRYLQRIINDYDNDEISDVKAKTISTMLNTYIKLIDTERSDTSITNDIELNETLQKVNEYLRHQQKRIDIISTKPLTEEQLKFEMDRIREMVR